MPSFYPNFSSKNSNHARLQHLNSDHAIQSAVPGDIADTVRQILLGAARPLEKAFVLVKLKGTKTCHNKK